jgi:hypothetical protein
LGNAVIVDLTVDRVNAPMIRAEGTLEMLVLINSDPAWMRRGFWSGRLRNHKTVIPFMRGFAFDSRAVIRGLTGDSRDAIKSSRASGLILTDFPIRITARSPDEMW